MPGPRAQEVAGHIYDMIEALQGRVTLLEKETKGPPDVAPLEVGEWPWSTQFPVDALPDVPPEELPPQYNVAHILTRRRGNDGAREVMPVWAHQFDKAKPGNFYMEHRRREPQSAESAWWLRGNSLAYLIRGARLFGKSSTESWHRDGKLVDPWDTEIDFIEFAGSIDPGWVFAPAPPPMPDVRPEWTNGDIVTWLPIRLINSEEAEVRSVFWVDGEFWLGDWHSTIQPSWYRIDDGRLLTRDGRDLTSSFFYGALIPDDVWPEVT